MLSLHTLATLHTPMAACDNEFLPLCSCKKGSKKSTHTLPSRLLAIDNPSSFWPASRCSLVFVSPLRRPHSIDSIRFSSPRTAPIQLAQAFDLVR